MQMTCKRVSALSKLAWGKRCFPWSPIHPTVVISGLGVPNFHRFSDLGLWAVVGRHARATCFLSGHCFFSFSQKSLLGVLGATQTATSEDSAGCRCPRRNLHAERGGLSFQALKLCLSLVAWQMALGGEGLGLALDPSVLGSPTCKTGIPHPEGCCDLIDR